MIGFLRRAFAALGAALYPHADVVPAPRVGPPLPGHPENLVASALSPAERALWRQLR